MRPIESKLQEILRDLDSLSGDVIGESGESWQEAYDRLSWNLVLFGRILCEESKGPFPVFPSIREAFEEVCQ